MSDTGVSLDGAVLQIDRDAQASIYGATTTPRMVFEGRSQVTPPSAVVAFRDQLEESTHNARVARGTGAGAGTEPAVAASVPDPAVPAAQTQGTQAPAATSAPAASGPAPTQGFEPVGEESTRTEPLP